MEWLCTSFQCTDGLLEKYIAMAGNTHLRRVGIPSEIKKKAASIQ